MGEIDKIKEEIKELSDQLNIYQKEYYQNNAPTISDNEYDALMDRLIELERQYPQLVLPDSPSHRVGSDLTGSFPEVKHQYPMLSLDKVYTSEGIVSWINKSCQKANRLLSFTLEEKIDGVSLVLYYQNGVLDKAVTRGNGLVGNDVTSNAKTITSIPLRLTHPITIAVRGEVFINKEDFSQLNKSLEVPFANARNLASGTLRRIKSSETASVPLQMYVYDAYLPSPDSSYPTQVEMLSFMKSLGFPVNPNLSVIVADTKNIEVPPFASVVEISRLEEQLQTLHQKRGSLSHEIDGMVVKVNELEEREALGYTNHHPKWALAYKFDSPQGETVVNSIDVQVGRTGRITPVARVTPVKVAGSTISNITLHNQDYINLLELAIGDTVTISKRGDVIPAVERVIEKNVEANSTYKLPLRCPSCNTLLVTSGAHQFCPNRNSCKDQVIGRISFFVGKGQMDIENFGPETVNYLYEKGVLHDIPDLYTIDYSSLVDDVGFGNKKVQLLEKGVTESKKRPYETVLVSLGLPDLGKKGVQLLINGGIKDIDTLLGYAQKGDIEPLVAIKGIGEKSANTLFAALTDPYMVHLIESLKNLGLQFEAREDESKENVEQIFAGQTWVITGSFVNFAPRSLAEKELVARGAKVTTSISKSTTYLLAGEKGGSKINKARNLGVEIINEEQFIAMLKGE